jgi:hypothetical protein
MSAIQTRGWRRWPPAGGVGIGVGRIVVLASVDIRQIGRILLTGPMVVVPARLPLRLLDSSMRWQWGTLRQVGAIS